MDLSKVGCAAHEGLYAGFGLNLPSFHNSVCGYDSLIYFLGSRSINWCQVLSWHERIAGLEETGNITGAIALGLQCWEGRAVAVVGLPRNQDDARAILSEHLNGLLQSQFNNVARTHGFQSGSEAVASMKHVAGLIISTCVRTAQIDLIYKQWFGLFQSVAHARSFVETVPPFLTLYPNPLP